MSKKTTDIIQQTEKTMQTIQTGQENTQESSDILNKKKKPIPFIVAVIALIVILVGIGVYSTPVNRLQRELNLGQRYLDEMNYEQAIVAFEAAIDIDPMNVEAYLGLADVYMGIDNIEAAITILEQGYERTENEKIWRKLDELHDSMEGIEQPIVEGVKNMDEEDLEKIDAIEEDSRWSNPKIEIDVETEKAIKEVVSLGNTEQYQEACQLIGKAEFIKMIEKYSSVINDISCQGTINTFCDEYIIYVSLSYGPGDGHGCDFICIPENGTGFIISREYGTNSDGKPVDNWGYMTCHVDSYKFNGLCNSYYVYPDAVEIGEVKLKDSYYDGEKILTQTWNETGNSHISMIMYDDGYEVPYGEDGEYVITSKEISDDYEGGARQKKEDFEKNNKERLGPRSANIHSISCRRINDKMPWE